MLPWNLLVTVCLGYVALLFAIAFWADRRATQGRAGWLRSPWVYTLSLSVYCTAWTFYGAVGSAARSGYEFLPIYLGPTLVFAAWFFLLRKLVRIGKTQRITSIADLISSRYGKSPALGVAVTLLAVVGSTPYIALQLKSLTLSFSVFAIGHRQRRAPARLRGDRALGRARPRRLHHPLRHPQRRRQRAPPRRRRRHRDRGGRQARRAHRRRRLRHLGPVRRPRGRLRGDAAPPRRDRHDLHPALGHAHLPLGHRDHLPAAHVPGPRRRALRKNATSPPPPGPSRSTSR
jgi:hypothetical protein